MYGVYRVMADGKHQYCSRSATHSEKLAKEIARDFSNGEIVMPDGSLKQVPARPHIHKKI